MPDWTRPWPAGASTGLGSMPGLDALEASRVVAGEVPDLPFLPELIERGAGAEFIGRTAAVLVGLHVDVTVGRWRLVDRRGRDERRAAEFLEQDLDAMEEVMGSHRGPVKVQLLGPWSLAASLELPKGDKALADEGAVRDLAGSLSEGVAQHVAEVRRRLPRAERVLVQFDEPLLPMVLAGRLPTISGWGRLPVPETATAEEVLGQVLQAAGGDAGVSCPVPGPPVALLRRAGAAFVAIQADHLESFPEEDLGEAIEAGTGILLGLVPADDAPADVDRLAAPARRHWERLGLASDHWGGVVVTPAGDLAELSLDQAAAVLARCRSVATNLQEPEGDGDWRGDERRD